MADESTATESPVADATNGDTAAEKRYTRSFTPERGYDTVALVGVVAPSELAVSAEVMADIEAKLAEAGIKILKTAIPALTEVTVDSSKRWTRVTGDTPETHKAPKAKATSSKRLDAFFEATLDLAKLKKRAMALADAKVKAGMAQADARRAALVEAGREQIADETELAEALNKIGIRITASKVDAAVAASEAK